MTLSDSSPEDRCHCNINKYLVEEITTFQNVRAVYKIPVCQLLEVGLGPDLLMHLTLMHWFSTSGCDPFVILSWEGHLRPSKTTDTYYS